MAPTRRGELARLCRERAKEQQVVKNGLVYGEPSKAQRLEAKTKGKQEIQAAIAAAKAKNVKASWKHQQNAELVLRRNGGFLTGRDPVSNALDAARRAMNRNNPAEMIEHLTDALRKTSQLKP